MGHSLTPLIPTKVGIHRASVDSHWGASSLRTSPFPDAYPLNSAWIPAFAGMSGGI